MTAMHGPQQEMNHRQRKQCYMHSTIFDEQGPSPNSVYAPSRQHELYDKFSSNLGQANQKSPEIIIPKAADIKCTQNAGHNAVLPKTNGRDAMHGMARRSDEDHVVYDGETQRVVKASGKDHDTIPKEFWSTSTTLQWHDTRNEQCRNKNKGVNRQGYCAQDMKRQELSSEIFGTERKTDASTTMPKTELLSDSADYLRTDSALHDRKRCEELGDNPNGVSESRMRMHKNLSSSMNNTVPIHEASHQAPLPRQRIQGEDDPDTMQRRRQEKSFSDLFGTQMRERKDMRGNREEVLATHGCSFLDTRGEIAQRNKSHWKHAEDASPANRMEAQLNSTLFGHESPQKPSLDPGLEEVYRQERSCWDSKDAMHSCMEKARRTRLRDHRSDFDDTQGHTDASRKQDSMASMQMRLSMGAGRPEPRTSVEMTSSRNKGPGPEDREDLLKSPKSTKLASLQSSIFG